jgi:hypothetical protein
MHVTRRRDAFRLCSLNEIVKIVSTDFLSRLGHNIRSEPDERALHLFAWVHPAKMLSKRVLV